MKNGKHLQLYQAERAGGLLKSVMTLLSMGGSGKTVVASSVARDPEVTARFASICFVGVGQDADLRELQRSIHFQLVQSVMDPSLREEEAFATLQDAAAGRNLLILIDDAWQLDQVRRLNCIDPRTASRALVTTRISGLVPGAPAEFSLGVLAPDDAVAREECDTRAKRIMPLRGSERQSLGCFFRGAGANL